MMIGSSIYVVAVIDGLLCSDSTVLSSARSNQSHAPFASQDIVCSLSN